MLLYFFHIEYQSRRLAEYLRYKKYKIALINHHKINIKKKKTPVVTMYFYCIKVLLFLKYIMHILKYMIVSTFFEYEK